MVASCFPNSKHEHRHCVFCFLYIFAASARTVHTQQMFNKSFESWSFSVIGFQHMSQCQQMEIDKMRFINVCVTAYKTSRITEINLSLHWCVYEIDSSFGIRQ